MRTLLIITFSIFISTNLNGQELTVGFRDSIQSEILNETRAFLISLPEDYETSDKEYPVLYRLDGYYSLLLETVGTVHRLVYHEEITPEMIVVLIKNTDRMRDMWPLRSKEGPDNFQNFLGKELIPFIDKNYRTTNYNILCGQSVSSAFTLYSFLSGQSPFDAFIAASAGFPGGEEFYYNLAKEIKPPKVADKILVMTNGLSDTYDPDQQIHKNSYKLYEILKNKKGLKSTYLIYEKEDHVPFQSLYHGLKFIFE